MCGHRLVRIGHEGLQPLMTTALLSFPRLLFYAFVNELASPFYIRFALDRCLPRYAPGGGVFVLRNSYPKAQNGTIGQNGAGTEPQARRRPEWSHKARNGTIGPMLGQEGDVSPNSLPPSWPSGPGQGIVFQPPPRPFGPGKIVCPRPAPPGPDEIKYTRGWALVSGTSAEGRTESDAPSLMLFPVFSRFRGQSASHVRITDNLWRKRPIRRVFSGP